jgi:hypothetical protein
VSVLKKDPVSQQCCREKRRRRRSQRERRTSSSVGAGVEWDGGGAPSLSFGPGEEAREAKERRKKKALWG